MRILRFQRAPKRAPKRLKTILTDRNGYVRITLQNLQNTQQKWPLSLDSDPRLQFQVARRQRIAEARGGSAGESASEIPGTPPGYFAKIHMV
jgi:hypothetical protein